MTRDKPQRDFTVLGGKRPDGASERARAALGWAHAQRLSDRAKTEPTIDPICVEPSCGRTLFAHYASGEATIGHPFRYSEDDDELLVQPPSRELGELDAAFAEVVAAIRPGVVKAISLGQYPVEYERAGEWTALLVYEPQYYGNGATPAIALHVLAAALRDGAA